MAAMLPFGESRGHRVRSNLPLRYLLKLRRRARSAISPATRERVSATIADWKRGKLPEFFQKKTTKQASLPAALEIVEEPPSPVSRAVAGTIMLFFGVALLWTCVGRVDIIAPAQGEIVPTGRTKIIQPLEAGVVRAIHVQDGQVVKAGEVLIEIDFTITELRDRLQKEYIQAELDLPV